MSFSLRATLLLTTAIAILLAIGIGVLRLKQYVEDSVANSYRLVSAGELFLDFKDSTGKWPRDWASLEEFASTSGAQLFACTTFDDFRKNILIDFDIDLASVDTTAQWSEVKPPLELIVAKTGQTHGAIFDPNELIYLRLREDSMLQSTPD